MTKREKSWWNETDENRFTHLRKERRSRRIAVAHATRVVHVPLIVAHLLFGTIAAPDPQVLFVAHSPMTASFFWHPHELVLDRVAQRLDRQARRSFQAFDARELKHFHPLIVRLLVCFISEPQLLNVSLTLNIYKITDSFLHIWTLCAETQ